MKLEIEGCKERIKYSWGSE